MEFKCKSCGAQLHFDQGQISSKCEYCGNTYMIFDFLDKETQRYQEKKHLELKIVFKINAVHFSDGKIKTYRNVKEIVIHEIK